MDRRLDELLLTHRAFLCRLAHDLVQAEDADDLTQQTLLTALQRPPRQQDSLRAWLAAVARRAASRLRRSDRRRQSRETRWAQSAAGTTAAATDDVLAHQELVVAIATAVAELPEPYRTTVDLRYYQGLSSRQVAARTETSEATVKTRLHRARGLLRARLDREQRLGDWRVALTPLAHLHGTGTGVGVLTMSIQTKVLLGAAIAVLAALPFLLRTETSPQLARGTDATARPAATFPPSATPPVDRAAAAPQLPATTAGVRGTVVLASGEAQAGIGLQCWIGPHPDANAGRWTRCESTTSASNGEFAIAVADDVEVMLTVDDPRWQLAAPAPPRATAPAAGLRVEVRAVPTAHLVVRARDLDTGELQHAFRCAFRVADPHAPRPRSAESFAGGVSTAATSTGTIELDIALFDATTTHEVQVDLLEPGTAHERVVVHAGATIELELALRRGPNVRGIVTDARGRPIEGALVFAGTQRRARGDEPGKLFDGARIGDGVRTDARGAFTLACDAGHATAWHPGFSPRTVPVAAAHLIELADLGEIRGQLLDAGGRPRADTELLLDRSRSTRTDASGRFVFADVEAGPRLLHVPGARPAKLTGTRGGPWVVPVGAAAIREVTLSAGQPQVALSLTEHGGATSAALVGVGPGTSLAFGAIRGDTLVLDGIVTGDYVLITDRGAVVPCTITGPIATVRCTPADATCRLVVATATPGRFHLVPADADDLVRVMVARMVRLEANGGGELVFGPVPTGRYELCRGDEPAGIAVHLFSDETQLRVD